ncbi:Mediator of RNA polymerase II transcription subunit 21 [Schistosoma haematobium]|uniref:Mediator of RNA polymerase II transcription subunit 21 n=1 Tax=Schistosoma haematobium TaxID=6185 RepID=A0A922LTY4_SCHHA|nr:Mediator of RNA polymerase II transcription subunit 21 [Schistosoma haematobium]KAH9593939.1 Mediator of RNA polymerase II transcription subunit 21 [Schistosoma haematobium]
MYLSTFYYFQLPTWMADRLTELQDAINLQAENLCNAIGVIQQVAQPSFFSDFNWASRSAKPEYQAFIQAQPTDDIARSFAVAISATAKQLDALIGALPEEEASADIQRATVHKLLEAYRSEGAKLARITTKLESRLADVRRCLTAIAQTQLTTQSLESEITCSC